MLQMTKMEHGKLSVHVLDPAFEALPQSYKEGKIRKKKKNNKKKKALNYDHLNAPTIFLWESSPCLFSVHKVFKKSLSDIHLSDVKNVSLFPAKLEISFNKRNLEILRKTVCSASVESVLSGEKENSQVREKSSHAMLF